LVEIDPFFTENKIFKCHQYILINSLNIALFKDGRGSLFEHRVALCHVCLKMEMGFWKRSKKMWEAYSKKIHTILRFQFKLPNVLEVNARSNAFPEC
jgi:hypothetical protein